MISTMSACSCHKRLPLPFKEFIIQRNQSKAPALTIKLFLGNMPGCHRAHCWHIDVIQIILVQEIQKNFHFLCIEYVSNCMTCDLQRMFQRIIRISLMTSLVAILRNNFRWTQT